MHSIIIKTPPITLEPSSLRPQIMALLASQFPPSHPQPRWQFYGFGEKLKIDLVRDLLTTISYAGDHGLTIYLLGDFHLASRDIQNTLLKALEEPPPSVLLILLTPNLGPILPTVQSRCQILSLSPPPHCVTSTPAALAAKLIPSLISPPNSSVLAQLLATEITKAHQKLPRDTISLAAFTSQTITELTILADRQLHSGDLTLQRLLPVLLHAQKLLAANVSSKNVTYWLAISLQANVEVPGF